jgi:hypothetical protein
MKGEVMNETTNEEPQPADDSEEKQPRAATKRGTDHDPETEEDTASGGAPEPPDRG